MRGRATPVAIVIAVIVLIVVLGLIYKFTLGRGGAKVPEGAVPKPGQYQQGMPGAPAQPGTAAPAPQPTGPGG